MTKGRGRYIIRASLLQVRRRGREVEGTPLLREHAAKNCIEGSNPSVSATTSVVSLLIAIDKALIFQGFFIF